MSSAERASRSLSRPASRETSAIECSLASQGPSKVGQLTTVQPCAVESGLNSLALLPPFDASSAVNGSATLDSDGDFDIFFQQLLSADLTEFSVPLFWPHQ